MILAKFNAICAFWESVLFSSCYQTVEQIQLIITQQVSKVFGQNGGLESVRTQLLWAMFIERRQRFNVLLLKIIYRAFCVECNFLFS